MTALRRPGSPWRILAHTWIGKRQGGLRYGDSWHVDNEAGVTDREERIDGGLYFSREYHFPGTEFDELVVGEWLHVEQMSGRRWWMNVGGVTLWVTADKDGKPKRVTVFGPTDCDVPREGCVYECEWTPLPEAKP